DQYHSASRSASTGRVTGTIDRRLLTVDFPSATSLRHAARTQAAPLRDDFGALAQLGERRNGIAEVDGSIPSCSTNKSSPYPKGCGLSCAWGPIGAPPGSVTPA